MVAPKRIDSRGFLRFMRRLLEVAENNSADDLSAYRAYALKKYPDMVPLIDEYFSLVSKTASGLSVDSGRPSRRANVNQMHLFDLLRERQLFPLNTDLAEFGARIFPNLPKRRFDKMGRADIAARIIEYLETLDPAKRRDLEESMRSALKRPTQVKGDPRTFFDRWESIIKGI